MIYCKKSLGCNFMEEKLNYRYIKERIPEGVGLSVFELIDSTNTEARRSLLSGASAPAVFVAEEQSAGRGRTGKSFYSPKGTGLYLSLLLDGSEIGGDGVFLTSAAAVAVRRAIFEVTGISPEIKWVNDLYLDEKKVCGILAESMAFGNRRYIILGVGINLSTDVFPDGLTDTAASLGVSGVANKLCARCVSLLLSVCAEPNRRELMEEYRRFSCVLGREIIYTENGVLYEGIARDINEYGHLAVEDSCGRIRMLSGGEISLRTKNIIRTAEPTPFSSGVELRAALGGRIKKTECEMATLFVLDRIAHNIHESRGIVTLINEGYDIICDRYYYSTLAYQGHSTSYEWVKAMNLLCPEIRRPDACIFLDLLPEQSLERISGGARAFTEIYETKEKLSAVRDSFHRAFEMVKDTDNVITINAYGTIDSIADEIYAEVSKI